MSWNDFNSAEDQQAFDVIPRGTLAKVRMTIRPGGFDNAHQGWQGGYATCSETTGAVYLNCEFVILDGPYAKRKIWSLIGLHSAKGPEWGNMGRTMIKGILNSANRLLPDDQSPTAQQARRIDGLHRLDGIEFVAKIGIEKDSHDDLKNTIKMAITPDHNEYAALMNGIAATVQPSTAATTTAHTQSQLGATTPTGRPAWAQ